MTKKNIVAGVQSTNSLTLANYLGAIKNFVNLQNENNLFVFVADLHSITTPFDPKLLFENRKNVAKIYTACGLDVEKNLVFYQSSVIEHCQLAYLLMCHTYMGELSRMTQFKDKSAKQINANGTNFIPTGLLIYPCLMAADILLYDADIVVAGKDQKQHMELTRTIAERFNSKYGKTFVVPDIYSIKNSEKIMDLQNPSIKMSKSNQNEKGTIFLLESLESVRKKIMSARTDSLDSVKHDMENQPGVTNLINIYCSIEDVKIEEAEKKFKNLKYGEFKKIVADSVCNLLEKIQKKFNDISKDDVEFEKTLIKNGKKCSEIAFKKINQVQKKIGLFSK